MGMFDEITCKYPLPYDGANALIYQTKSTPSQWLDRYEIREDGTLWHEVYDTEDQSEAAKWKAANPGKELPETMKGWRSFVAAMARVNKRWLPVSDFIGELRFYTTPVPGGWLEWSAYFKDGKLVSMNQVKAGK